MSGTKISDHFADGDDFEECLSIATENAASTFQHDFCHDWKVKWENYGMNGFMSKRQADTLRSIAEMEE